MGSPVLPRLLRGSALLFALAALAPLPACARAATPEARHGGQEGARSREAQPAAPTPPAAAPSTRLLAISAQRLLDVQSLPGGGFVVDAKVLVYAATARGPLALVGDLASYADLRGGDDLVGAGSTPPARERVLELGGGEISVATDATLRRWNGTTWTVTRAAGSRRRQYREETNVVARDGATWTWSESRLERRDAGGETRRIALPAPPTSRTLPSFHGSMEGQMSAVFDRRGGGPPRYWQETHLELQPPATVLPELQPEAVLQVVPLDDGSVVVVAYSHNDKRFTQAKMLVYRWGQNDGAETDEPLFIGTTFDQQIAVRNAVPPRPYVPTCPQAFVPLEGATDPATRKRIAEEARRAERARVAITLVAGRFDTPTVVEGALIHATRPEGEREVSRFVTALGSRSGGATCSVPTVVRYLDPPRPPPSD